MGTSVRNLTSLSLVLPTRSVLAQTLANQDEATGQTLATCLRGAWTPPGSESNGVSNRGRWRGPPSRHADNVRMPSAEEPHRAAAVARVQPVPESSLPVRGYAGLVPEKRHGRA